MTADIEITKDVSGETMIVHLEAHTDAGVEFLDSYNPIGFEYTVIDSGRLLIPDDADVIESVKTLALLDGVTVE